MAKYPKWTKADKQMVLDLVNYWQSALQLDRWDIQLVFSDDRDHEFSADAIRETPYRTGIITIYPKILMQKGAPRLETTIIHELIHLILWPLDEWGEKDDYDQASFNWCNEEITDWISQTIYHLTES